MAFWKKKEIDFTEMNAVIEEHPGMTAAELARLLEVERSTVARRLPSMDEAGFYLYEDEAGGLYRFDSADL